MSRAYLCAKSAIDWTNTSDARRSATIAGARQALIGSDLPTIHAARREADPTLPEFAQLTTTDLAALQLETDSVITTGANEHAITIANVAEGPGISIRSSWYERSLLQRLGVIPEASPVEDPALRRLHASWLIQRS